LYALAGSSAIVLMSNDFISLDTATARTLSRQDIPTGKAAGAPVETLSGCMLVEAKAERELA